jgi:hypothetical protein
MESKKIKKINRLLEQMQVVLGVIDPRSLAIEYIASLEAFEVWRNDNYIELPVGRPEGIVATVEELFQFLRAKVGDYNFTNDLMFAVIDELEKLGVPTVALRTVEYIKPFRHQDMMRYNKPLGQDSVL